ncbi:unnamed protein product, partial [Staurois parvus]
MPRPSRRPSRGRPSHQEDGESPIAHRTRSRVQRHRRREEASTHRSRSPRERAGAPEHYPPPAMQQHARAPENPPAMEQRAEEEVSVCPICLAGCEDGENTTILACDHEFHTSCCRWFGENPTCPLCRADFSNQLFLLRNYVHEVVNGDMWIGYVIGDDGAIYVQFIAV